MNAIVHQVAEEYGILVAPLYLAFNGPEGDQDSEGYLEDGIHTNAAGDAIIADLLRELEYGQAFARVAKATGIDILRTPFQAPKANATCERFLGSVRRECLDFCLILSERHLYRTIKEYQAYFNQCRPHQGIGQHIPCPRQPDQLHRTEEIVSRPILGGLHHDYRRRAQERKTVACAA